MYRIMSRILVLRRVAPLVILVLNYIDSIDLFWPNTYDISVFHQVEELGIGMDDDIF